jgi:phosphate transport system protein
MSTFLEASFQRDVERIRTKVTEMGSLAELALQDCVKALSEEDRQTAYAVILRDQYVDEKEKEIDRLCLEFLVRQQPVGGPLRFVYSTIRINLELERVGDYAETIARQLLKLGRVPAEVPKDGLVDLSRNAILMLRGSIQAFVAEDADLARRTIELEDAVDLQKSQLIRQLVTLYRENKIPFESLDPLTTFVRRFERVADQARNIATEVLYMCTGEYSKHPGAEVFRVLFVDQHDSGPTKIAEAIANGLNQPKFIFSTAGLDPRPVSAATVEFLQGKGHDATHLVPRTLLQVPNLEHYHLIVALSPDVKKAFPRRPRKSIYLEWDVQDPAALEDAPERRRAAFETTYRVLYENINEIVQAILKS